MNTAKITFLCAIYLFLCCLAGCSYYQKELTARKVLGGRTLVFEVSPHDHVTIEGDGVEQCKAKVTLFIRSENEEQADELVRRASVYFKDEGDNVMIGMKQPWAWAFGPAVEKAHYRVVVPRDTSIIAQTHNGHLSVSNIGGYVRCKTVNGSIILDSVKGDICVKTSSGYVSCTDISGDNVRIESISGPVHVSKSPFGTCQVNTVNGDIECGNISGEVNLETYNASIFIWDSQSNNCKLKTNSGYVSCRNVKGNVDVYTRKGSVSLTATSL